MVSGIILKDRGLERDVTQGKVSLQQGLGIRGSGLMVLPPT